MKAKAIDLKFVQLHDTLFLAGTNHGQKLDISRRDIKLTFDLESDFLVVEFKNEVALIPRTNVSSMAPIESKPFIVEANEKSETKPLRATAKEPELTPVQKAKVKAQVSDPTRDPVFGAGQ